MPATRAGALGVSRVAAGLVPATVLLGVQSVGQTMWQNGLKFVSIALVTCGLALMGISVVNQPPAKEGQTSACFSPVHWMFWMMGTDIEEELQNPTPVFEPGPSIVPAWDSEQVSDLARFFREEQEKRDQMMEEIRARWGTPK